VTNQTIDQTGAQAVAAATRPVVRYLHHVSFRVDDLEKSLEFYCGLLGFDRVERPEMDFVGAWLQNHDIQVHLLQLPVDDKTGTPATAPVGKANHVAFTVDNLAEMREYLEQSGVPVGSGDQSLPQFFVQDPTGNVIEFTALSR
jgi:glyoxylase I family protein